MPERDTPQPETAEQLGQQLLEFVDEAEFGTVQFRAVSDYLDLRALYGSREWNMNRLVGASENKAERASDIRVQEMKIALLEHQIEQNKAQLPGYSRAYQHMETALDDIDSLAKVEAETKYPDVAEQQHYVRQIWEVAYNGAHEIVSMKRDTS
jgi:hypothetical protein